MSETQLVRVADRFWQFARHIEDQLPRDMESAIAWSVPLFVVRLPHVSVRDVQDYLRQRQLPVHIGTEDRPLHGCIVAIHGKGLIIVDGSDGASEVRFTLAHEVAHFLLDYQIPRQRAVARLGTKIEDVLDGRRRATQAERIDGILGNTPIELYAHFMHRNDGLIGTNKILNAESHADLLAFELLAPETEVWRALPRPFAKRTYPERMATVQRLLMRRFGLPSDAAQQYSTTLCRSRFGGPSVREWLGL
jgi:hypothetical protein